MNIDRIIKTVCEHRCVHRETVLSHSRKQSICETRQIIQYFAVKFKAGSLREICEKTRRIQHGTIKYSVKTVENLIFSDANFRREIAYLEKQLTNPPDHDFARKMIDSYNRETGDNISFDEMNLFSEWLINKIYKISLNSNAK